MHPKNTGFIVVLGAVIMLLGGCTLSRKPVPVELRGRAQPVGFTDIRAFIDDPNTLLYKDLITVLSGRTDPDIHDFLTLSGGGPNGAFGAGFLKGWSQRNDRPDFRIVTGISTGALIAPYAFLGQEYDQKLGQLYTTVKSKDIINLGGFISWIWTTPQAKSPLAKLLAQNIDRQFLDAIAAEHRRGRRLYVGTTNLDAQRLTVWNMGEIASSRHENAEKLFEKVLLASSSVPVLFPPVYFDVELDGKRYDEMHVDGGIIREMFFHGDMVDLSRIKHDALGSPVTEHLYIICNDKSMPSPEPVVNGILGVKKAVLTLIKSHAIADIYRMRTLTEDRHIGFNYISVPLDFQSKSMEIFDQAEMNDLYDRGLKMATDKDFKWQKVPPGT